MFVENTILVNFGALPKKVQNLKHPVQDFQSLAAVPRPTFLPDLRRGALGEGVGWGAWAEVMQPPQSRGEAGMDRT